MQALSRPSGHREAKGCSTSPISSVSASVRRTISAGSSRLVYTTPACHLPNRPTTSNDNNSSCATVFLTNIPDPVKTYRTSDQASTSKDPDFYEYWDSSRKELYHSLLWPLETVLPASDSSSSNGCVRSLGLSSSFSSTLTELPKRSSEKTLWPSYRYTVVDGTVAADTKSLPDHPKIKTMKLRLCPTSEQKRTLEQWAGCSRFTYNKAVAIRLAEGSTHKDPFRIRDRIVTFKKRAAGRDHTNKPRPENTFLKNRPWLRQCPKSIRSGAVDDACSNIKACFSNLKANNITHFDAPFRSKHNEKLRGWSIQLEQANVQRKGHSLSIFEKLLGNMKYRKTKQLLKLMPKAHPDHDPKIQKNAFGEYFLLVSISRSPRVRGPTNPRLQLSDRAPGEVAVAALDPGVRKTLTSYSPENGESFMLGKGQATELSKLLVCYDQMCSEATRCKTCKGQKKLKAAMLRVRKRIFYLKKEFRDQTANFLARRYDVLLVPKLGTKEMTLCAGRKLKTKVVRQMLSLGHSLLFNRLKEKCSDYGTMLLEVKEHYTSQTCLSCGCLNKCGETYTCRSCGFTCDRDICGAAGIFLKAVRAVNPLP